MEKTIAKSFGVELNPVHLKLDGKHLPSAFPTKAGTRNHCMSITKDLWCKYHP